MPSIFVSYRQGDSTESAERIYGYLLARYGTVYHDAGPVQQGMDRRRVLIERVRHVDVVFVIIGRRWAALPGLNNPEDPTYVAIAVALATPGRVVVPLLVQGAVMPHAELLPPRLQGLANRSPFSVREAPDFEVDMERLLQAVMPQVSPPAPPVMNPAPPSQPRPRPAAAPPSAPAPVRRADTGCMTLLGWPFRVIGSAFGILGGLIGTIVHTALRSTVALITTVLVSGLLLAFIVFFVLAMIENNLDISAALAQIGEEVVRIGRGLLPGGG